MKREPIDSSSLLSVGYDPATQTLEVEFRKGGRIYQYLDVPEFIFRGLMLARSKGSYFNQTIEDRYTFRDVTYVTATDAKRTGLMCPNCREPMGIIEKSLPNELSLSCPACQFRWTAHEAEASPQQIVD